MSASAFLISLFVVSFTLIISPFISKFWFNVFLSDFKGNTFSAVTTPDRFLKYSFGGMDVFLDFYNLKVGMVNSISQLVMLLGVFGRLNAIQIVLNTIIYNITWNLCHFLCANLQLQGPDSRIFDDYQISNVYLFASCYSLILLLILKSPRISMKADIQSSVVALLGTFFVFLSFCATSTLFPLKFTPGQAEYARSYIWQEGFLNIFFALVGSVIFSCVGSIVLGGFTEGSKALEGKIGLRECVFGTITGGIIYGPVAGTAVNIGAAIASGLFSGLLSSIIYRFVVNKINSSELRDSYGVTNTLSVSFMATFCISPSILIAYFNRDWILPTLEVSNFDKVGLPLINASIAGWVIAYVGISMGIGLVSGAAAGGILFFFKSVSRGHDQDFFNMQYGLTSSNV
uniref:Predicted protein n=1 Tax=Hordeum vulgare subsp. vulgare TaxID=112509 RepID=F2E5B2_HORVV|nr:predicted protein [Hordeum vulgare subsp. vulgare]